MGLFSSKTKIYTSSSVYNMAGDVDQRPNVMAAIVVGAILSRSKSTGSEIARSLRGSTAMSQRRFFRWAKDHYVYGVPKAQLKRNIPLGAGTIQNAIKASLAPGARVQVIAAEIRNAHVDLWAEEWVLQNRPDVNEDNWTADYLPVEQQIVITIADPDSPAPAESVTIPAPADLIWAGEVPNRKLLCASYRLLSLDPVTGLLQSGNPLLYTYRMGSGVRPGLEVFSTVEGSDGEFFPALPVRINNKSIRHDKFANVYDNIADGFKKLTGGQKFDQLIDQIEENDQIDDIDFCFVVPAVSLNTPDKTGKRYILEFFRNMRTLQGDTVFEAPETAAPKERFDKNLQWNRWVLGHSLGEGNFTHPLYGKPEPETPPLPAVRDERVEIQVKMEGLDSFALTLGWSTVSETLEFGNSKTVAQGSTAEPAKVGDVWMKAREEAEQERKADNRFLDLLTPREVFFKPVTLQIYHQVSAHQFKILTVSELEFTNHIYSGRLEKISAVKALQDEDESGFLIPLHYPTLTSLGLAKGAQLSVASNYLLFNSYEEVKQKWYQKGIFKVILAIGVVAISIVTSGASLATMGGILGSNVAVGTLLGASAATAAVAGAVANAVAGMVLTTIIGRASTALFGEKLGAIIGTLVSFIGMTYGTQFAMQGNLAVDWGQILRVENLMKLTNSVGDAYARWQVAGTADIYAQIQELTNTQEDKLDEIEKKTREILGMTSGVISPMMLTDTAEYFGESREAFLGRTLLTGSDLVELSHGLIENFAELSLEIQQINP